MSLFRDKLDQKTYDFIFQTLVINQFTSRLQLKLLTSEQLDHMFSKDLALVAKALLVYHVDLLKDESPLPTKTKERTKEVHGNETSTAYFISSLSCLNMSFANEVVNNTRNGLFVEFQLFSDFCWPFIL